MSQESWFTRFMNNIAKDEYSFGKHKIKMEYVWLGLIFIVALLLRIYNNTPSVYSFWIDEAEYANRSSYILAHNGLYDPTKLFDHPPLFMYLQSAFFLIFGRDWYVARGFVVLLGIINVYIFYLIGKEWKDKRSGLILGTLFAVQPLTMFINRQVMLENLLLLLMSASFLAVVKYEKTQKQHFFLLAVVLFSLAMLTKFTGAVFILPLLAYIFVKKSYKSLTLLYSALLFLVIVIPVIYVMLPHGVVEFHLRKTSGGGYVIGDEFIYLGNFTALVMTLVWLNIGIFPFIIEAKKRFGNLREGGDKLKQWASNNPLTFFVVIWTLTSLIFFSLFTFMASQYIYTIMIPILILLGLILYKTIKMCKAIIVLFLVISICCVLVFKFEGANDTVEFLQENVEDGDSLIASDKAIFSYYFPSNDVYDPTIDNIISLNATFIVLKASSHGKMLKNDTVKDLLDDNYVLVFETDKGDFDVNFLVFERR